MIFLHTTRNDDAEPEEEESEDAGLDDSMLAELGEDDAVDETEGFGHIKDEEEEDEEEDKADESLEEDAEDVDYDSFDDEDHL